MFHGNDKDSVANFQEDYKLLKEKQTECRSLYFMMEEQVNQYKTMDQIGHAIHTSESDDYIRDRHINNIDQLRSADGKLADIMLMGHEAVKNSR